MSTPSTGRIIYSAVSGKSSVSTFNGPSNTEISDLSARLLQSIDLSQDTKKSYSAKGYTFNYVTEKQACFLCVADETFARRMCFTFLERVKQEYSQKGKVPKSFLEHEMQYFSNPDADKLANLQGQVGELKGIMIENIDRILERGEKMEEIDRQTADMVVSSQAFHTSSRKLKCELIRKNIKLTLILCGICIAILVIIGLTLYFKLK